MLYKHGSSEDLVVKDGVTISQQFVEGVDKNPIPEHMTELLFHFRLLPSLITPRDINITHSSNLMDLIAQYRDVVLFKAFELC